MARPRLRGRVPTLFREAKRVTDAILTAIADVDLAIQSMGFLDNLDSSQRKAVTTKSQHVLVIAGAGSGKTRVLTHRAAYLINEGVPNGTIMVMTFTNKAANEMKERLAKLSIPIRHMWMGTFHSLCVKMLRSLGDEIGIRKGFSIYDEEDRTAVLTEILKRHGAFDRENLALVRSSISNWKNTLVSPTAAAAGATDFETFAAGVYQEYEAILTAQNAVDFDGLLVKSVRLLERSQTARNWIHGRFRHLLVDEYQDTNMAQYRLLTLMKSFNCSLFVVGDADQSIYQFRGADIRNILHFQQDYANVEVVNLTYNYRSCPEIVNSANVLVRHNTKRLDDKYCLPFRKEIARIGLREAEDEYAEASFVTHIIKCFKAFNYPLDEVAILYRTHFLARIFERTLLEEKIPYRIVGGPALGDRQESKDLLAFLKLMSNPADRVALKRIFRVYPGLGDATYKKVKDQIGLGANYDDVVDAIRQQGLVKGGKAACATLADLLQRLALQPPAPANLLNLLVKELDYEGILIRRDPEAVENRMENVNLLVILAMQTTDIEEFLTNIGLGNVQEEETGGRVSLMTVHGAKGLEFGVIFVTGMEEGIFPHSRCMTDGTIEEERRLAYVAMTRAKDELYLTRAKRRMVFGKPQRYPPSRFLKEIPAGSITLMT